MASLAQREDGEEKDILNQEGGDLLYRRSVPPKVSFIKERPTRMVDSDIDKMIAISDIYKQVLQNLEELKGEEIENMEKAGMTDFAGRAREGRACRCRPMIL